MFLKIDSISIQRNKKLLFQDFNLNLKKSQTLILKGSNGIGKSTLLETIAGILETKRGKILIDTNKLLSGVQKKILFIGHENCLKDSLSVFENLNVWLRLNKIKLSKKQITKKLSFFKIDNLCDSSLKSLSMGQKRKVALSKLLFTESFVWILDEPTNGLDAQSERKFLSLLDAHQKKGGSTILSSHLEFQFKTALIIDLNKFAFQKKTHPEFNSWEML